MKPLSARASAIAPSPTVAMDARYKELLAGGRPVLSLGAGEPDVPMPEAGVEAAVRALKEGKTRYSFMAGLPELRAAISRKFREENSLDIPAENILVTSGAKQAVYTALTALLNPGDEVLIPSPYWVTYPEAVRLLGAVPVEIATRFEEGFKLTPGALRAAVTPRTKLLLLNSPCNPTGAVYTRAELEALAAVAVAADLYVLSDEIYEHILYEGSAAAISIASLGPEMAERTATVNGFSKAFAMQGLRLGYVGAPAAWAKAMIAVQSHAAHHPSTISQYAAVACLEAAPGVLPAMRAHYAEAREYTLSRLRSIPGIRWNDPDGAFYVFIDISGLLPASAPSTAPGGNRQVTDSVSLGEYLLEEWNLATVPGLGFGREGYLRISFANSRAVLEQALDRLEQGLRVLVPHAPA